MPTADTKNIQMICYERGIALWPKSFEVCVAKCAVDGSSQVSKPRLGVVPVSRLVPHPLRFDIHPTLASPFLPSSSVVHRPPMTIFRDHMQHDSGRAESPWFSTALNADATTVLSEFLHLGLAQGCGAHLKPRL
jgi:hypothetical protein